jgi:hypothetical protein
MVSIRGRILTGTVMSTKMHRTSLPGTLATAHKAWETHVEIGLGSMY